MSIATTLCPTHGQFHRARGLIARRRVRRTFIKGHDDIRPQSGLNTHGFLRVQEDFGTINRGAELDSRLVNLAQLGEAKDLKTTRVGQNWP